MLYVSDMHLELRPNLNYNKLFQQSAKYLILAGDIGNPVKEKQAYTNFLKTASSHFQHIFYVLGNHEYYNNQRIPMFDMKDKICHICSQFPNIHILDNNTYELDNITILGATLWSQALMTESVYCNDYRMIWSSQLQSQTSSSPTLQTSSPLSILETNNITVEQTNTLHTEAVLWLKDNISKSSRPCLVITHHAPLVNKPGYYLSHPRYTKTSCFQTDLSHLLCNKVKIWVYGHTHYSNDFNFLTTRVCSNQVGYEKEQLVFDYSKHIDLDQLWIDDI